MRRPILAVAVVAVLAAVAGVVVLTRGHAPEPPAACGTTDVARGRPVTASSVEQAALSPANVTDGLPGTRWGSEWGDPQWIQVDLGASTPVCQVVLSWEQAYATAYDVQVSDDGERWTALASTTLGRGGTETVPVSGSGRYVRILLRARATAYGYSLWSLAVHAGVGRPGPAPAGARSESLLSYLKPAEASSGRDDKGCSRCDAARVSDMDTATEWMTAPGSTGPAWLRLDLGAPAVISRVELRWDKTYPRSYGIQVSPDGTTWTTAWSTGTGDGGIDTISLNTRGRYVRMTAPAGQYALWEFRVYGTGGAPLPAPPEPDVPAEPYRLIWSDDFTGDAGQPPDPSKWRPETGPGVTGELQYYTDNQNARLDGKGDLVISARREVTPGSKCPRDPISNSTTCQYTSGRLNTSGLFSFTYGRVEARIKVSGTQGLWPAFWMLGADLFTGRAPWPNAGEIDVMEHVGRTPGEISSTLHAPAYNGADGVGKVYRTTGDLSMDFHTYAADWRPDRITFSVDGKAFFVADRATIERTRGPWVFDRPFVLLLNNAVGGPFPGPPGAGTRLPQDMVVDYVHVYR